MKAYITGCLHRIETNHSLDRESLIAIMKKISTEVSSAGDKIHCIKNFTHMGPGCLEKISLTELINNLVNRLEDKFRQYHVKLRVELDNFLVTKKVDKIQIEQVLLNIINNSIEAMSEAQIAHPELYLQAKIHDAHMLVISVTDNGPGIQDAILENIFMPCFTTKKNGMGMGLSICRSIIEFHGGEIIAQSLENNGCLIQFTLPLNDYEN